MPAEVKWPVVPRGGRERAPGLAAAPVGAWSAITVAAAPSGAHSRRPLAPCPLPRGAPRGQDPRREDLPCGLPGADAPGSEDAPLIRGCWAAGGTERPGRGPDGAGSGGAPTEPGAPRAGELSLCLALLFGGC